MDERYSTSCFVFSSLNICDSILKCNLVSCFVLFAVHDITNLVQFMVIILFIDLSAVLVRM
jgi:hypothetical protein